MKVLISIVILTLATLSFANPNTVIHLDAKYDPVSGDLIAPDQILLVKGLKAYQSGYYKSSLSYLRKSAAFGNSEAQKTIGLMHIKSLGVNQDWAKGYAWIKLAALDGTSKKKQLETNIKGNLKPEEIEQAKKEYSELSKHYNTTVTDTRRYRWYLKQKSKVVGSRVGAQTGKVQQMRIVENGTSATLGSLNGKTVSGVDNMNEFMTEYNFGLLEPAKSIIISGEIETVD